MFGLPHLLVSSLTLVSFFTLPTTLASGPPPAFTVYPASNLSVIDPVVACNQLNVTIPVLLAHLANEPLTITNVISQAYLEGANPTTTMFFNGIPAPVLQPAANIAGAIGTIGEWTRASIMADLGYGEEDSIQTAQGGLPAFCRFGASITTSSASAVWFETWMPLPATAGQNASNATTTTSSSSNSATITPLNFMELLKSTSSHHTSSSTKKSSSHHKSSSTKKSSSTNKSSNAKKSSTTTHKSSSTKKHSTTSSKKASTTSHKTTSSSKHKTTSTSSHKTTSTSSRKPTTSSSHKSSSTHKTTSSSSHKTTSSSHHTTSSSSKHKSSSTKKASTTSHKSSSTKKASTSSHKTTSSSSHKTSSSSTKKTTSTTSKTSSTKVVGATSSSSSSSSAPTATNTGPVIGRAPSSRWRGRMVFIGNSAQSGGVNYPEMKQVLTRYREVAVSTNGGHFGSGSLTTWAIGNPQSQLDFGQRGVHVSTIAAQAVVKAFYGIQDRTDNSGNSRYGFNSYFKGCSTGGRQGFSEAQAYPRDYDGIMSGAPAIYYNDLNAYQIHVNYLQSNSSSPGYIPTSLYPLIHNQIIEQCDLNDGVMDSVIEDPSSCNPDFEQLLCPSSTTMMTTSTPTSTSTSATSSTVVSTVTVPTMITTTASSTSTSTSSTISTSTTSTTSTSTSSTTSTTTTPTSSSTSTTSTSSTSTSPTTTSTTITTTSTTTSTSTSTTSSPTSSTTTSTTTSPTSSTTTGTSTTSPTTGVSTVTTTTTGASTATPSTVTTTTASPTTTSTTLSTVTSTETTSTYTTTTATSTDTTTTSATTGTTTTTSTVSTGSTTTTAAPLSRRQATTTYSSSSTAPAQVPTCLTQPQLDNLASIYTALTYPDGSIIHEPVLYGSEFSWTVTDGVVGTPFPPAPGWFQYQVLGQSTPTSSFNPYTAVEGNYALIQQGAQMNPGNTNTNNPDLSAFFARGSKFLHYHGLSDQLIPSGASDRFFKMVNQVSSAPSSISNSYRYFRIPGMAHCRGGDGAYNFGGASQTSNAGSRPLSYDTDHDALLALFSWTEYGNAPNYIIGAAYKSSSNEQPSNIGATTDQRPYGNGVKFTHKMCPYPQQAVLIDPSNPYDANSLICE